MVLGVVNARLEPIINLSLISQSGRTLEIEAVIDTGFDGFLLLPSDMVLELGLEYLYNSPLVLADGTMGRLDVYSVMILWEGRIREVRAIESTGMALVGMGMLYGHRLTVDVVEGGQVRIDSL